MSDNKATLETLQSDWTAIPTAVEQSRLATSRATPN